VPDVGPRGLAHGEPAAGADLPADRHELPRGGDLPKGSRRGRVPHPTDRRYGRDATGAVSHPGNLRRVGRGRFPRRAVGGVLRPRPQAPAGHRAEGPPRGATHGALAMTSFLQHLRTLRLAAWLGWQLETNWASPWLFALYMLVKPVCGSLMLVCM